MLFNSIQFLVFLPVVTAVYFALRNQAYRRWWLLGASLYFYSVWSLPFTGLLLFTVLLDYTAARVIGNAQSLRVKRIALWTSIVLNLSVLFLFKYADFFCLSLARLIGMQPWPLLAMVLPAGISFYTFESMSYTIDVYRGRMAACKSVLDFALFVSFFPHLVAGPIMRAYDLIPQFYERVPLEYRRALEGTLLVCWGLGKKVFLADPMGRLTEQVYNRADHYSGAALLLGTYAFAVQIYLDFSGYSDVARGAGRILGYDIMQNFRSPYLATSIRDFWRRWHISLSSWLRDYLYVPLGGNRSGPIRTYVNLFLTMLLGGLWHGANWTFVMWGALHGTYLAFERLTGLDKEGPLSWPRRLVGGLVTFHLVCLAWVFFRSANAGQAFTILSRILTWAPGPEVSLVPILLLALVLLGELAFPGSDDGLKPLMRFPHLARWVAYVALAVLAVAIAGGRSPEFIYFQF